MSRASIVVDLRHIRCGNCKIALHDELAVSCPACGAKFDSITSNHVGLAAKFEKRREAAGVRSIHACPNSSDDDAVELIGS